MFSNLKEAFFSILFGLLAGGIGAVIIFSYLDFNEQGNKEQYESKLLETEKIISELKNQVKITDAKILEYDAIISRINSKINSTTENNLLNKNALDKDNERINELFSITSKANEKTLEIEDPKNQRRNSIQRILG